jgi:hypothetical protein
MAPEEILDISSLRSSYIGWALGNGLVAAAVNDEVT